MFVLHLSYFLLLSTTNCLKSSFSPWLLTTSTRAPVRPTPSGLPPIGLPTIGLSSTLKPYIGLPQISPLSPFGLSSTPKPYIGLPQISPLSPFGLSSTPKPYIGLPQISPPSPFVPPMGMPMGWLMPNYLSPVKSLPRIRKDLACVNNTLLLSCPRGYQISVLNADYGRYSRIICPSSVPKLDNDLCMSQPGTTDVVKEMCNERDSCVIQEFDKLFTKRCANTSKYLQVTYTCVKYSRACEGSNLRVSCPYGRRIKIYDANYGRTLPGSIACPSEKSNNTECYSGNAVAMSQNICDNQYSCIIPASTEFFGDPCVGTSKYLEVRYVCQ